MTKEPVAERALRLCVEMAQAVQDKKEAAKMHSENVKRIKAELDELIKAELELPEPTS